jgi:hypothetical protein
MRPVKIGRVRTTIDQTTRKVDMRIWISVITDAKRNPFSLKIPSDGRPKGIQTMRRPVVVIERRGLQGLKTQVADIWKSGYSPQGGSVCLYKNDTIGLDPGRDDPGPQLQQAGEDIGL